MQRAFIVRLEALVVSVAHAHIPSYITSGFGFSKFFNAVDGIAAVFFIRP